MFYRLNQYLACNIVGPNYMYIGLYHHPSLDSASLKDKYLIYILKTISKERIILSVK